MGNKLDAGAAVPRTIGRATRTFVITVGMALPLAGCGRSGTADQPAATTIVADPSIPTSYTDLAALREYVAVPGDPVSVRFGAVPMGSKSNDDRVPGPTDYSFPAVIEYADAQAAAAAAGRSSETAATVRVDDTWYPAELQNLADTIDSYGWPELDVTEHQPDPAWVDTAYVVDAAPRYVVVYYRPSTN